MTILQNKRVSVVVPNYNYGRYIGKRLDSIAKQTYPIYELIILDDKSTDNSIKVIRKKIAEIKRQHPLLKVKIIENEANSGKAIAQWKKGFELARGDYVWIAEADDLSSKHFLAEAMKGFDDPGTVISYTESAIINSFGVKLAPNFRWSRDKEKTGHYKNSYIKDGREEIEEIMAIRCTIPNVSSVVFKKNKKMMKYLDEVIKFKQVGDWYFYVKVLENGKIAYNRKSLNKFRVHNGSVTGKSKKGVEHIREVVRMHKMIEQEFNISDNVKKWMKDEETRIKERHQNK